MIVHGGEIAAAGRLVRVGEERPLYTPTDR